MRALAGFVAFVALVGCAASKPKETTPIGACGAEPTTSAATNAHVPVPTNGVPTPEQVCERIRVMVVASGGKGPEIDEGVRDCLEQLVDLRVEDPESYACEARCLMILPGVGGDVSCEDLCDAHAEDACVDMKKEDATLGDARIAACRDRIARIRASTDDRTVLCALGCASAASSLRGMDECFGRCSPP